MLLSRLLLGVHVVGQRALLVGCGGAPALCQPGALCLGSPRAQLAYRLVLTCECDTVALSPSHGVGLYVLRPATTTTHATAQHGFTTYDVLCMCFSLCCGTCVWRMHLTTSFPPSLCPCRGPCPGVAGGTHLMTTLWHYTRPGGHARRPAGAPETRDWLHGCAAVGLV